MSLGSGLPPLPGAGSAQAFPKGAPRVVDVVVPKGVVKGTSVQPVVIVAADGGVKEIVLRRGKSVVKHAGLSRRKIVWTPKLTGLTPGKHTIAVEVTDTLGRTSPTKTAQVTIAGPTAAMKSGQSDEPQKDGWMVAEAGGCETDPDCMFCMKCASNAASGPMLNEAECEARCAVDPATYVHADWAHVVHVGNPAMCKQPDDPCSDLEFMSCAASLGSCALDFGVSCLFLGCSCANCFQ